MSKTNQNQLKNCFRKIKRFVDEILFIKKVNKDIVGKSGSTSAMDPVPLDPQHFGFLDPDPMDKIERTKKPFAL